MAGFVLYNEAEAGGRVPHVVDDGIVVLVVPRALVGRDWGVARGDGVLRRALERDDGGCSRRDCREQLHAGRAASDDADAFAVDLDVRRPLGRVCEPALEGVDAGDVWKDRFRQESDRRDEIARNEFLARVCSHDPRVLGVVPGRGCDISVQLDVWAHVVFRHHVLDVRQDFRLRQVAVRPWIGSQVLLVQ